MISASEISEHEYCEVAWYYRKKGVMPPKKDRKIEEKRLERGKEIHKKMERKIEHQKIKVKVGAWLIILALISAGLLLLLFLS